MKTCKNCGAQLDDLVEVCPECGFKQPKIETQDETGIDNKIKNGNKDFNLMTLVKIIGIVVACLVLIFAIGDIFSFISSILSFIFSIVHIIFGNLFSYFIGFVGLLVVGVMFAFYAFKGCKENNKYFLLTTTMLSVINILIQLVSIALGSYKLNFFIRYHSFQFFVIVLLPVLASGLIFVLFYFNGDKTVLDIDYSKGYKPVVDIIGKCINDVLDFGFNSSVAIKDETINENRSIGKYILLSILTLGIYGYWFVYSLAKDINVMCKDDNETTSGLLLYMLLCFITCGLYNIYWKYKIGNRLSNAGPKYGIDFQENGTTILIWEVVGAVICSLGSYYSTYIIIKNTNTLAKLYNSSVK